MSYDYHRGIENLQRIDGNAGNEVISNLNSISPDLAKYIIEYAFGEVYERPQLGLRDRELITIAGLATMGDCQLQLKVHIEGALNVGIKPEEILEVFLHLSVYLGMPRSINATLTAKEVFRDRSLNRPAAK